MSLESHARDLVLFRELKGIDAVCAEISQHIVTGLYMGLKEDEMPGLQQFARQRINEHVGQMSAFLNALSEAAKEGKAEDVLAIIETWKGDLMIEESGKSKRKKAGRV